MKFKVAPSCGNYLDAEGKDTGKRGGAVCGREAVVSWNWEDGTSIMYMCATCANNQRAGFEKHGWAMHTEPIEVES